MELPVEHLQILLDHLAGHHCSWCFDAEGIRLKLMSAQADDKPRWGDYPDKLAIPYLEGLIQNGEWFDGTKTWTFSNDTTRKNYAPKYIMNHYDKFKYLLEPPGEIEN